MSVLVRTQIGNTTGYYLANTQFTIKNTPFLVIKSEITGQHLHDVNHTIKNQQTGATKILSMQQLIKAVSG